MNWGRTHIRTLTAIVAMLVLAVAPALHAAHGHDVSVAGHMHAPCAACQIHAPAAAAPQCPCGILALALAYHAVATPDEVLPASSRPAPNACRAPPFFVAS